VKVVDAHVIRLADDLVAIELHVGLERAIVQMLVPSAFSQDMKHNRHELKLGAHKTGMRIRPQTCPAYPPRYTRDDSRGSVGARSSRFLG
jgi:hypothetical protein